MKVATVCAICAAVLFASADASTRRLQQAPAPAPCVETIPALAEVANLTTLIDAVTAAGLADTLSSPDLAVALFAPTNAAFDEALEALDTTLDALIASDQLRLILDYHILPFPLLGDELEERVGEDLQTLLADQTVTPNVTDGNLIIEGYASDATVILANQFACQSVVHVVDAVLVPDLSPSALAPALAPAASA